MYISRIVIKNFRNFLLLDVTLGPGVTCLIGENNTGKTNFLHAIRLAIDSNFSSRNRTLVEQDLHSEADFSQPNQVIVSVEFKGFTDNLNQEALAGSWNIGDDTARINFRFRPRTKALEQIRDGEIDGTALSLQDDYHFEITGGGEGDPATVAWDESLGSTVRFGDLQAFHVEYLKAMRDVQQSLRSNYDSPLSRIFSAGDFSDTEKQKLESIISVANTDIEAQPTVKRTGEAIQKSFDKVSGEAFEMGMKLGMSDPSFVNISQSLKILLNNNALQDFEPWRNGLGLNNILYIGMLLEYFDRRINREKTAGELLLIEEPEAHLHPQLQRVLYSSLAERPFQTIISTHSTHISSQAPIGSFIAFTNDGTPSTGSCVPKAAAGLSDKEESDLNRFLDATRSTLLYARKVMLVEGPAELFLIPEMVRKAMGVDLDRHGITVIPIHGTHFDVYTKLFSEDGLRKKCAVVTDADLKVADVPADQDESAHFEFHDKDHLENDYVKVFACPVTFERAFTMHETIPMVIETIKEFDHPRILKKIEDHDMDRELALNDEESLIALNKIRKRVLKTAKSDGKARFAQVASKHVVDTNLPAYIRNAVTWLMQ